MMAWLKVMLLSILGIESLNIVLFSDASIALNIISALFAMGYLILLVTKVKKDRKWIQHLEELFVLFLVILPFRAYTTERVDKFIDLLIIYGIIYIFIFPLVYKHSLRSNKLGLFIIILITYIVTFGTFSYHILEGVDLMNSFWYACATITSVGYGDYVPTTILGKLSGIVVMFGGLLIIALFTTFIIEKFKVIVNFNQLNDKEKLERLRSEKSKIEQQISALEDE